MRWGTGGRKYPCQMPAWFVQFFRQITGLWQTDGNTMIANTALTWHHRTKTAKDYLHFRLSRQKTGQRNNIYPFNGPFSGTTQVSWYQKGKTNLDFTEARDSEWQWQVWTSSQTDNHASTPPLSFLQAGCPSCRPTNSVRALKAKKQAVC